MKITDLNVKDELLKQTHMYKENERNKYLHDFFFVPSDSSFKESEGYMKYLDNTSIYDTDLYKVNGGKVYFHTTISEKRRDYESDIKITDIPIRLLNRHDIISRCNRYIADSLSYNTTTGKWSSSIQSLNNEDEEIFNFLNKYNIASSQIANTIKNKLKSSMTKFTYGTYFTIDEFYKATGLRIYILKTIKEFGYGSSVNNNTYVISTKYKQEGQDYNNVRVCIQSNTVISIDFIDVFNNNTVLYNVRICDDRNPYIDMVRLFDNIYTDSETSESTTLTLNNSALDYTMLTNTSSGNYYSDTYSYDYNSNLKNILSGRTAIRTDKYDTNYAYYNIPKSLQFPVVSTNYRGIFYIYPTINEFSYDKFYDNIYKSGINYSNSQIYYPYNSFSRYVISNINSSTRAMDFYMRTPVNDYLKVRNNEIISFYRTNEMRDILSRIFPWITTRFNPTYLNIIPIDYYNKNDDDMTSNDMLETVKYTVDPSVSASTIFSATKIYKQNLWNLNSAIYSYSNLESGVKFYFTKASATISDKLYYYDTSDKLFYKVKNINKTTTEVVIDKSLSVYAGLFDRYLDRDSSKHNSTDGISPVSSGFMNSTYVGIVGSKPLIIRRNLIQNCLPFGMRQILEDNTTLHTECIANEDDPGQSDIYAPWLKFYNTNNLKYKDLIVYSENNKNYLCLKRTIHAKCDSIMIFKNGKLIKPDFIEEVDTTTSIVYLNIENLCDAAYYKNIVKNNMTSFINNPNNETLRDTIISMNCIIHIVYDSSPRFIENNRFNIKYQTPTNNTIPRDDNGNYIYSYKIPSNKKIDLHQTMAINESYHSNHDDSDIEIDNVENETYRYDNDGLYIRISEYDSTTDSYTYRYVIPSSYPDGEKRYTRLAKSCTYINEIESVDFEKDENGVDIMRLYTKTPLNNPNNIKLYQTNSSYGKYHINDEDDPFFVYDIPNQLLNTNENMIMFFDGLQLNKNYYNVDKRLFTRLFADKNLITVLKDGETELDDNDHFFYTCNISNMVLYQDIRNIEVKSKNLCSLLHVKSTYDKDIINSRVGRKNEYFHELPLSKKYMLFFINGYFANPYINIISPTTFSINRNWSIDIGNSETLGSPLNSNTARKSSINDGTADIFDIQIYVNSDYLYDVSKFTMYYNQNIETINIEDEESGIVKSYSYKTYDDILYNDLYEWLLANDQGLPVNFLTSDIDAIYNKHKDIYNNELDEAMALYEIFGKYILNKVDIDYDNSIYNEIREYFIKLFDMDDRMRLELEQYNDRRKYVY